MLDAVLLDYQKNVPAAREPEVLGTMATIVNKLEGHITKDIPKIFDAVFECTLDMINKDFEEFPEHRTNFFTLLQAVNSHCFAGNKNKGLNLRTIITLLVNQRRLHEMANLRHVFFFLQLF